MKIMSGGLGSLGGDGGAGDVVLGEVAAVGEGEEFGGGLGLSICV